MSTFVPTKRCHQSDAWNFQGILHVALHLCKSNCYTDAVFFLLLCMASSYSSTNTPLCHTLSKPLAKCKEGQPYGSLEHSRPPWRKELKQLWVLYLLSLTYKNLKADCSFVQLPSHLIISFKHLWTPHLVLPTITIPPLSAFSQIDKKKNQEPSCWL